MGKHFYIHHLVIGGHRRTGSTSVQQTLRVITLHKHSGFTMQNLKHDVAVLQLERPVKLSDKVNTVCLPDQDAALNSNCYITGLWEFNLINFKIHPVVWCRTKIRRKKMKFQDKERMCWRYEVVSECIVNLGILCLLSDFISSTTFLLQKKTL